MIVAGYIVNSRVFADGTVAVSHINPVYALTIFTLRTINSVRLQQTVSLHTHFPRIGLSL